MNGPVPMGWLLKARSPSFVTTALGTIMLNVSARMYGKMAMGLMSVKRMVYRFSTSMPDTLFALLATNAEAPLMTVSVAWPHEGAGLVCGSRERVMANCRSLAVASIPLLKRTPLGMRNVH